MVADSGPLEQDLAEVLPLPDRLAVGYHPGEVSDPPARDSEQGAEPASSSDASGAESPASGAESPASGAESPAATADPSRRHPGIRVLLAAGPALLLAAIALWEMVAVAGFDDHAPTDTDWSALSAALHARHRPGDLIVFAPGWIDPLGREHVGDLLPIDMAARMDGARYPVVWEVAAGGAHAPETAGESPVWSRRFGPLALRRYQRRAAVVLTDFAHAFASARVAGLAVGRPLVSLEEVGFQPHRCVVVVPRPDKTVTISYDGVALGRSLVGYVGLADVFTRRDVREPGRLVVTIDGREVARVTPGDDSGWVRFVAPTTPHKGQVTFAATAVGPGARDRRICFAAEARQ